MQDTDDFNGDVTIPKKENIRWDGKAAKLR